MVGSRVSFWYLGCVVGLALTVAIAGCAAANPNSVGSDDTGANSAGPNTTSPSGASPGTADPGAATTTATETPPSAPTCDSVLTEAEYASIASDGFTLQNLSPLGDVMQSMVEAGGLGCFWARGEGDVRIWYAELAQTPAEWEARRGELLAAGYTDIGEPFAGIVQGPTDNDADYIPAVTYRDGTLYFASYSGLLGSVLTLQ